MKETTSTGRVAIMKLKFIFIVAMSMLLPFVLVAEDTFEKVLESYKNVTSESLFNEREKKQTAVILKEKLDNTFLDGAMIEVPGKSYSILKTEVTQEFYEDVMGENHSKFKGEKNLPVGNVSWYDAIVFCNKLSVIDGLTPVYSVSGKTNVSEWDYEPHKGNSISNSVRCNKYANGYRLPTIKEWQYAAKGGQEFKYSGSDNLDEVAWYKDNSEEKTHPVAQKKPNGYGLYDMSGSVWEWCWDFHGDHERYNCGGSWNSSASFCEVESLICSSTSYCGDTRWYRGDLETYGQYPFIGFRIVRNIDE